VRLVLLARPDPLAALVTMAALAHLVLLVPAAPVAPLVLLARPDPLAALVTMAALAHLVLLVPVDPAALLAPLAPLGPLAPLAYQHTFIRIRQVELDPSHLLHRLAHTLLISTDVPEAVEGLLMLRPILEVAEVQEHVFWEFR
jgi:hypothetical protein